ncbi:MAG: restriction endonuclease, partial [Sedimentibacter sp.]
MVENNNTRKRFIKEALGTRNYFSYRTDLFLYKTMLSILVLLVIFLISSDWNLSILIAAEVFVIFTLINKLNITRKKNEGEEKLVTKMKKEHFKKKIDEINPEDFEMLIGFLYEKKGCMNFIKKGHMFLTEKDGLINCIKIYKLYDDIELEKIDVRNLITFMLQNNIKIGHLVTTGSLSEEAKELIEKFKDKLDIEVVDLDGLFSIMDEQSILPDNNYFYNKIADIKIIEKKKIKLKNNVFDIKKVIVYIL